MRLTHNLNNAVYAQGWIEGELEGQVKIATATGEGARIEATNMTLGQFQILSKTFEEVVQQLQAAEAKLGALESAFRD